MTENELKQSTFNTTDVVWSTNHVTHLRSSWSRFLRGFSTQYSSNNFDESIDIFHFEYKQTTGRWELHRRCYDNALVETSKEAVAATLLLVRKERDVRHSNNARIVDARKGIERLTRKHYIHDMKGVRKLLQEAKAVFQSVYKELKEQRINDQIGEDEGTFKASVPCNQS